MACHSCTDGSSTYARAADSLPDNDWADRAWAHSRTRAAQTRADRAAQAEERARRAERDAWLADHPPF